MVEGILEAGPKAFGKVATVVTDYITFMDITNMWEKVTGKPAAYVELSDEANSKIWGVMGDELGSQFRWSEQYPRWDKILGNKFISAEELGVKNRLIDTEACLTNMKSQLF